MKYFLYYSTTEEFEAAQQREPGEGVVSIVPGVSLTKDVDIVDYNPLPENALIFVNNTSNDGQITLLARGDSAPSITLQYSNDNAIYQTISSSENVVSGETLTFNLPANGKLYLKGKNRAFATSCNPANSTGKFWSFGGTVAHHLEGDIMAIVEDEVEMTQDYEFAGLFVMDSNLKTVNDGVLSSPVVSNYGYYDMFNLAGLTQMPSLTAMTIGDYAYAEMFRNAPFKSVGELPAMNIGKYCYNNMFRWATSLTGMTSTLPAMTLSEGCYSSMFVNCTRLTKAPEIMAENAYMTCFAAMFSTCTALVTPPVMHINRLEGEGTDVHADMCCQYMFQDCTSLTGTPEFFLNITGNVVTWRAFQYMFKNCRSLTYACNLPATGGTPFCYTQMFAGCTSLVNPPEIGLTDLGYGVTGRTSGNQCQGMFSGCTSLTSTPVLKSATLKLACYQDMFAGCTSLTQVTALFTNTSPSGLSPIDATYKFTTGWLDGVPATGTFIRSASATWDTNGVVPNGWTVQTQ